MLLVQLVFSVTRTLFFK